LEYGEVYTGEGQKTLHEMLSSSELLVINMVHKLYILR
jgi:hypothetical protein